MSFTNVTNVEYTYVQFKDSETGVAHIPADKFAEDGAVLVLINANAPVTATLLRAALGFGEDHIGDLSLSKVRLRDDMDFAKIRSTWRGFEPVVEYQMNRFSGAILAANGEAVPLASGIMVDYVIPAGSTYRLDVGTYYLTPDVVFPEPMVVIINVSDGGAALPPQPPSQALTVNPTASTVLVNGTSMAFEAYNIGGFNFFKLRDLAYAVNGTNKQFSVDWDAANNAISLTSGKPYVPAGGEMAQGAGTAMTATPTTSRVFLDGAELNLTAYNIGGNNFFRLRDIMRELDIGVTWNAATSTIGIDTSIGYTED
jgi:hypothetical protein